MSADIINVESTATEVRTAEVVAMEVRLIKRQTQKVMLQASMEIGKRLEEAKSLVEHGQWEEWLKDNVDYSQRTAEQLIQVYHQYGDVGMDRLFDENMDVFKELSYTQAVALLSLPTVEERRSFVQDNNVQDMSTRELQEAIKAKKSAEAELLANQDKLKEIKKKLKTYTADNAAMKRIADESQDIIKSKNEKIHQLQKELEDKSNSDANHDDPEKEAEIEKLQAEIVQLKKDAATDADMRQFKLQLDVIQSAFNRILDIIQPMEAEKKEKYKMATKRMINSLGELIDS
jgi:hypothetical protein